MQIRFDFRDVLGTDNTGIGVPRDFDRDAAWAEEYGRAEFADGHFAGAVSGFRVYDAMRHIRLHPYESAASSPDQRDCENDMLNDVCRFMRASFGHKCPHARVIMP